MSERAGEQPGSIDITSPEAGERWAVGSRHYVTWRAGAGVGAVSVSYSTDGGTSWLPVLDAASGRPVAPVAAADRALLWQVPEVAPARCRLRLAPAGGAATGKPAEAELEIIPSQQVHDYVWTPVTLDAAFAARDGAGALVLNDRMWLLGGWNPGDKVHFPRICNSEVWSSTDGRDWRLEVLEAPWEGRHTAGYAVHRDRMWIVGGDANQRHYQNDVWSSADGIHWDLALDPVPWIDRVLHYTVVHEDRIWIMGGQRMTAFVPGADEFYNDVWSSADGVEWTLVSEHAPWEPRGMIGGSAVLNGRIWLLGGGTYDTPARPRRRFFSDVWSSADGVEWRRHVERAPWAPRLYHEVAAFDGRLWVMEGHDGKANRNDVHYSIDGVNWYELPETPWAPRHAASVFVYEGGLWMVAGNNMTSDSWKLTRG